MNGPIEIFVQNCERKLADFQEEQLRFSESRFANSEKIEKLYQSRKAIFSDELNQQAVRISERATPWLLAKLKIIREDYEHKFELYHTEILIKHKIKEHL